MRAQAPKQGARKAALPRLRRQLNPSQTSDRSVDGPPAPDTADRDKEHASDGVFGASLLFWIFVLAHAALWTLVPALRNHNLPLDVVEHLAWGREWELGYHKHPPMVSWMLETAISLAGRHDVVVYALSQLCVAVAFIAMWRIARAMFPPWAALVAVLIGEGVVYHGFTSPEFNVNVASLPFWALAIALSHRLYSADTNERLTVFWACLGLVVAGAFLAKYTAALLGICLLILMLTPAAWHWWRKPGPYIAVGVGALVGLPHALWLIANGFPTFAYALGRGAGDETQLMDHVAAPLQFLASQAPAIAVGIVLAALAWPWRPRWPRFGNRQDLFLLVMGVGPIAVLMIISAVFAFELKAMWGTTLFTTLGLMVVAWGGPSCHGVALRRCVGGVVITLMIGAVIYLAEPTASARLLERGKRVQFPGPELARITEAHWERRFGEPLPMVVGDEWLGGTIAHYAEARPPVFLNANSKEAPWASMDALLRDGGIVVWMSDKRGSTAIPISESTLADLVERAPALEEQPPLELPWATSAPLRPLVIGWAMIPPQEVGTPVEKDGDSLVK